MSRKPVIPAPQVVVKPKSKRLIAAEHKHKEATLTLASAQARYDAGFARAAAINWDTPLGESLARKAEELAAEKNLKSAKTAMKRAVNSVLNAGGVLS